MSDQLELFGDTAVAKKKKTGSKGGKKKPKKSKKKKSGKKAGKSKGKKPRRKATAESMAAAQRDISVSEFFSKNRHLLGFDNPRKALLTAVKEAVDNSLDACEEAGILPDLLVEIFQKRDDRFRVCVQDNGPGIVKAQIPKIFGKLLYGSKFHRLRQSRGQQGIGISAAGMYGQMTTGLPVRIISKTKRGKPHLFEIQIDTQKNKPVVQKDEELKKADLDELGFGQNTTHGTRVEIEMEARYQRGHHSVDEYLRQTAVANPHVRLEYLAPDRDEYELHERGTRELPEEVEEIKPHPHGVELGTLLKMMQETQANHVEGFLKKDFGQVGAKTAKRICEKAKVSPRAWCSSAARSDVEALHKAIQETQIGAPPSTCIAPIGVDEIIAGLEKEVEAAWYTAVTRKPSVYRGNPFLVEVGLAYGRPEGEPDPTLLAEVLGEDAEEAEKKSRKRVEAEDYAGADLMGAADKPAHIIRLANRVPLQYQAGGCAITKGVVQTNWRSYGLQQSRGAAPVGPLVILVHIASAWVPFTSESKEAIASYDEILKEIKLGLQQCGRELGTFINKRKKRAAEEKKRSFIKKYIPQIGLALQDILDLSDKQRDTTVDKLTDVLERSRKMD